MNLQSRLIIFRQTIYENISSKFMWAKARDAKIILHDQTITIGVAYGPCVIPYHAGRRATVVSGPLFVLGINSSAPFDVHPSILLRSSSYSYCCADMIFR